MKLALAEMYVQGVSTRRVAITEQLCGYAVSATQVSQAAAALDEPPEPHGQQPRAAQPRGSRVAVLFPNVASCERLVTAVLMEISDE